MTKKKDRKDKAAPTDEKDVAANGETAQADAQDPAAEAEALAAENGQLKQELLYQRAELENFKRRMMKRQEDSLKFAAEPLVADILPILDNIERAIDHAKDGNDEVSAFREGLVHIQGQLLQALSKQGVEPIEAEGRKFDPNLHEALAQMPGEADNVVMMVHEKGYLMKGKLIRPAKVVVSRLANG